MSSPAVVPPAQRDGPHPSPAPPLTRRGAAPRRMRFADDVARLAVAALIVAAVAFLLVPLVIVVSMSFDARDYLGTFPPPALSLRWYAQFFSQPYLINGLKTSLLLATVSAFASTAIGVAAAVAIGRCERRRRDLLSSIVLAPLIMPGVVIGFALLLFYARLGFGDPLLRLLGGHVLITFPYAVRTVMAALSGIRPSLGEAALTLGATERQAFWTVTMPLAKTGIAAGAIFAFAFSLDDVAVSLFLSGPQTYTLPVALLNMMYANFDLTIAAAAVLFVASTAALMVALDALVGLDRIAGAGGVQRA